MSSLPDKGHVNTFRVVIMGAFTIRRLIQSAVVLLLVTIIVFISMRLLPGDPIRMLITSSEESSYTEQQMEFLRHENGLDKPLPLQYINWLGGVLHGDLGKSILDRLPVTTEIFKRLPITFHLGILAFLLGLLIGIPMGIISAVRRGTWIDTLVTVLSNLGITVPQFWLGILLVFFFGLTLKWLPVMGYTSPFDNFWMSTKQVILPVICLAVFPIASTARQTRSSMLEVIRQDYIRTAWAKGLEEKTIILRHALKNGLIPIITLAGMGIPIIVGGTVLIETVFNIPGMGRLAITSVMNQDYPYVQAIILIIAAVVLFTNFIVEMAYGWIDPRIRYD
jgi:peptide/nickel transport system permease protein